MGLDDSMFEFALEYLSEEENIFIVNLSSNTIIISNQLNNLKKKEKPGKNKADNKKELL
jgi:hypothetical protein